MRNGIVALLVCCFEVVVIGGGFGGWCWVDFGWLMVVGLWIWWVLI